MRFILFNAIVGYAIFYLFTNHPEMTGRPDQAKATVTQVQKMAESVEQEVLENLSRTFPEADQTNSGDAFSSFDQGQEPEATPHHFEERDVTPQPVLAGNPAYSRTLTKPTEGFGEPLSSKESHGGMADPKPTMVEETALTDETQEESPALMEAEAIPTPTPQIRAKPRTQPRSQPRTRRPPPTAKAALPMDDMDPAVTQRRAEVLGEREVEQLIADNGVIAEYVSPTPTQPVIGIAEGESFMTPRERRQELYALAQEMELLYLKNTIE
ncbi:MAG: hypothetical protein HQL52_05505 [Magnetococcales bacterium]|nr:hypothetical protein [Magnetococcales bacterium]